jgi:hypothetical protein
MNSMVVIPETVINVQTSDPEQQKWLDFLHSDPAKAKAMWIRGLNPVLRNCVRISPYDKNCLALEHPLLPVEFVLTYPPSQINAWFEKAVQAANEFKKAGNWLDYVDCHVKRFQLEAFRNIEKKLSNAEYWQILSSIWTYSDNIWQHIDEWVSALRSSRPERQEFMSPEERAAFESLPPILTIYRGYQPRRNRNGLSWTLSRETAEFMSNYVVLPGTDIKLTGKDGKVRQKTISKKEAFAYLCDRKEEEIIFFGDFNQETVN